MDTEEAARNVARATKKMEAATPRHHESITTAEADVHKVPDKSNKKKKRGMKPRSQRNRKRPRSELHPNGNVKYETEICRLALDGRTVDGTTYKWIRIVRPYPYTFATHAKERWLGRTVLDVYHSEFGSYPKLYYEDAILQGRILVSDKTVDVNYKIKSGDVLTHTVHRHEPAVAASSSQVGVDILAETSDLVVVNKPGTLPVHPCGGYHMNSLSQILEPRFGKLYNINRLDRLTSGLVMLGKSSAVAQQLGKCLMQRQSCRKVYLARVRGKFPLKCPLEVNAIQRIGKRLPCREGEWIEALNGIQDPSRCRQPRKSAGEMRHSNALGVWITDLNAELQETSTLQEVFETQYSVDSWLNVLKLANDDGESGTPASDGELPLRLRWLQLACPTRVINPKDGIFDAGAFEELDDCVYEKTVKPSQTAFSVVHYDEETDSTVVLCKPSTGRTHQIRLHLQYLGHPIANDPNYGGELFFGKKEERDAFERARVQLDALNEANRTAVKKFENPEICTTITKSSEPATTTDTPATESDLKALAHLRRNDNEPLQDFVMRSCVWCARSHGERNSHDRATLEFLCRSQGIWLHALAYYMVDASGLQIYYQTPVPPWALTPSTRTDDDDKQEISKPAG